MMNTLAVRALPCAVVWLLTAGVNAQVERATLRPAITATYAALPLREVLADLSAKSGKQIRALWADESEPDGLNPGTPVTAACTKSRLGPALDTALRDTGATWQITEDGAIEVGTRARLNRRLTMRVYDVHDLLHTVPSFGTAPTIDLAAAIAGRGSVPLQERDASAQPVSPEDPAAALVELISSTIESDQWKDMGGIATISINKGCLVVRAPGYIHRQIESPWVEVRM